MKPLKQELFIKQLENEVQRLYVAREKAGNTPEAKKMEAELFGYQSGLLYVIDYLKNVYRLK